MVNEKVMLENIKNKLDGMTREEQIEYLKKMGFEIEVENIDYEEEKKLRERINKSQCIFSYEITYESIKQKFLAEIIAILGYKTYTIVGPDEDEQVKKQENIERNAKVIACIYPEISFLKMLNLFETIEEKENFVKIIEKLINKYKKEYKNKVNIKK